MWWPCSAFTLSCWQCCSDRGGHVWRVAAPAARGPRAALREHDPRGCAARRPLPAAHRRARPCAGRPSLLRPLPVRRQALPPPSSSRAQAGPPSSVLFPCAGRPSLPPSSSRAQAGPPSSVLFPCAGRPSLLRPLPVRRQALPPPSSSRPPCRCQPEQPRPLDREIKRLASNCAKAWQLFWGVCIASGCCCWNLSAACSWSSPAMLIISKQHPAGTSPLCFTQEACSLGSRRSRQHG